LTPLVGTSADKASLPIHPGPRASSMIMTDVFLMVPAIKPYSWLGAVGRLFRRASGALTHLLDQIGRHGLLVILNLLA
jgi:hypothetical protein